MPRTPQHHKFTVSYAPEQTKHLGSLNSEDLKGKVWHLLQRTPNFRKESTRLSKKCFRCIEFLIDDDQATEVNFLSVRELVDGLQQALNALGSHRLLGNLKPRKLRPIYFSLFVTSLGGLSFPSLPMVITKTKTPTNDWKKIEEKDANVSFI